MAKKEKFQKNTLSKVEKFIVNISKRDNLSIATMEISPKNFNKQERFSLSEWGVIFKDKPKKYPTRKNMKPKTRLDFCYENMPILIRNVKEFSKKNNLIKGKRILIHMIMETKTGAFIKGLRKMGAEVFVHSFADYTDNSIVNELRKEGFEIFADEFASYKEDEKYGIEAFKRAKPDYIIDDGAHLTEILINNVPNSMSQIKGICEETTSGVDFFRDLEKKNKLKTSVVAVNDSKIKTNFDNVHGTTETVIAMILRLTKKTFNNKNVVVQGYGPVGKGCALRARALNANVIVTEINPLKALEAVHDGFKVLKIEDAVLDADFIITASGYKKALDSKTLQRVKDKCVIASAGGTFNEIDYRPLVKKNIAFYDDTDKDTCVLIFKKTDSKNIKTTKKTNANFGKKIYILSNALGANYTSGEGNPIEIMDLSFAGQIKGLEFLIKNHKKKNLKNKVYYLEDKDSEEVAKIKLETLGIKL